MTSIKEASEKRTHVASTVVAPPSYTIPISFAKTIAEVSPAQHGFYEGMLSCLGSCLGCIGAYVPCCWFICNPFHTVPQGTVGLQSHFGKVTRVVDPGFYYVNILTDAIALVDIKINITDVPRQVVMTRDNVSIDIDSVLCWHIVEPFVARFQVADVSKALMERTMTTLKDTIGAHDLQSVITNREGLAREIKAIIEPTASSWGVVVETILIKDLQFSRDLQETLSSAAKQKRIGESKVIAAQADVDSAKLMREASDILNTPAAMQIRYLETLSNMSRTSGTKVIFMPLNGDSGLKDMTRNLVLEQQANE